MRKESYAELINSAKVMVSGLKLNTERVGKRGITGEFINKLESIQKSAMDLDNEQEDLKAKLKTKFSHIVHVLLISTCWEEQSTNVQSNSTCRENNSTSVL